MLGHRPRRSAPLSLRMNYESPRCVCVCESRRVCVHYDNRTMAAISDCRQLSIQGLRRSTAQSDSRTLCQRRIMAPRSVAGASEHLLLPTVCLAAPNRVCRPEYTCACVQST